MTNGEAVYEKKLYNRSNCSDIIIRKGEKR